MLNFLRPFRIALGFLTRFPVGGISGTDEECGRSMAYFPLAGAILGAAWAACAWALSPATPMIASLVLIAVMASLTGAVHLDGFADTLDGFGGARDRESTLAIMKDSRIGTFGVVGLVLLILFKFVIIAHLLKTPVRYKALIMAPVLARWSIVLAAWCSGYARPDGTGRPFVCFMRGVDGIAATAVAVLLAAVLFMELAPVLILTAALISLAVVWEAGRRIGGVTGDVLGAACEISEVAVLAVMAWMPWMQVYPVDWFANV